MSDSLNKIFGSPSQMRSSLSLSSHQALFNSSLLVVAAFDVLFLKEGEEEISSKQAIFHKVRDVNS